MTQDELNAVYEQAFREGFYAGFAHSAEGWNGEYPFDDANMDKIKTHEAINRAVDKALKGRS